MSFLSSFTLMDALMQQGWGRGEIKLRSLKAGEDGARNIRNVTCGWQDWEDSEPGTCGVLTRQRIPTH
jgi:hypothetical protein